MLRYWPESFAMSEAFLIAFFLLFVADHDAAGAARRAAARHRSDDLVNSTPAVRPADIVFGLQYGLLRHIDYGVALSALAMAAFYVVLATTMKKHAALALPFDASLAIATIFLTLVIRSRSTRAAPPAPGRSEAAGLVWIGFRQARMLPRAFGYLLFVLSAGAMLNALRPSWPADGSSTPTCSTA